MSDDEFLQAVGEHLDLVYNLARRLTRSRPQAEDLVQETYLRALRGWRRRPPQDVRGWLATICLNIARAGWRRDRTRPAEVLNRKWGGRAGKWAERWWRRCPQARAWEYRHGFPAADRYGSTCERPLLYAGG